MPRIERIRIVGLKYEKMQKQVDDMILELSDENGPNNTLITLVNGGGKGVLFQAIFQLLIPKTTWGKKNNHVESFFFNHKKQLRPYTFHVAIEWRLDNEEKVEYCTTGIAMTANIGSDQQEAKVDYLLYAVIDYGEGAELGLDSLPLFNVELKQPTTFDAIQQFVKSRRNEIVVFGSHSSDTKKYYDFLAERDIHISEWRNMKRINGQEGGIKGYFEKNDAFTNDKLFENLILPEIGAGLNEGIREDESSLHNMFLDSAIVAQRLPILEQRESTYKEFLVLADPLCKLVEQGNKVEIEYRENLQLGMKIFTAIQEEVANAEAEQLKWSRELDQYQKDAKELKFAKENLVYLKRKYESDAKQDELSRLGDDEKRAKMRLEDSKILETDLQAAYFIAHRKEFQEHNKYLRNEIRVLEESSILKEKQEEQLNVKRKIQSQWGIVSKLWRQMNTHFRLRSEELELESSSLSKQKQLIDREIGSIEARLNKMNMDIRLFNDDMLRMIKKYGPDEASSPATVLNKIEQTLPRLNMEISQINQEKRLNEEKRVLLLQKQSALNASIEAVGSEVRHWKDSLMAQNDRESQLWDQLVILLGFFDNHAGESSTELFLKEEIIRTRFIHKIDELTYQLKRCRRDYYGYLLDAELQKESHWVPNADIYAVREALEVNNVSCTLGTAFLSALSEDQRKEEFLRHPLLPYGVIVTKNSKLQVDFLTEVMLKSPVPIFVREEMSMQDQTSYMLPQNQSVDLIISPEKFNSWKANMHGNLKKEEEAVQDFDVSLAKLNLACQDYERLLTSENSKSLSSKVGQIQDRLADLHKKKEELACEITSNNDVFLHLSQELGQMEDQKREHEQKAGVFRDWLDRTTKQELCLVEKQRIVERKKEIEKEFEGLTRQLTFIGEQSSNIIYQREHWLGTTKHTVFPRLRNCLPEMVYPDELGTENGVQETLIDEKEQEKLLILLTEFEGLQQTLTENSLEIKTREVQIQSANDRIRELEISLIELDPLWQKRPEPSESRDTIAFQQKRQRAETAALEDDYYSVHETFVRCEVIASGLFSELLEIERRIAKDNDGRKVELWTGSIAEKEIEVQEQAEKNVRLISECHDVLQGIRMTLESYQNQIKMLGFHIEEGTAYREVPWEIRQGIRERCEFLVDQWLSSHKSLRNQNDIIGKQVKAEKASLGIKIAKCGWAKELESKIHERLNTLNWDDYENTSIVLSSMMRNSRDQIQMIQSDKEHMELTRKLWVSRAAKRVIQIIEILKRMERRMIVHNQNAYLFPLVRFNYRNITVPRITEDVEPLLTEYFNRCIRELLQKYPKVEQAPIQAIKEKINDGRIVYISMQNRFPILQVYKPTTDNHFLYARSEDHHYSDWEIINQGSIDEAVGSGGQTQSVQLLVAMMIMTHKRVNRENKGWTVFLYDNPFGEMASKHVLDPVFEISKALRFQWLIVTPPELVKNDISTRFNVFWQLSFSGAKGEVVESTLVKGGRKVAPLTLF